MRIAFVSIDTVHHRETETNQRFQTILEVLRDHGHDVHCFCAGFWDDESPTLERDEITYHAVTDDVDARRSFCLRLPFDLAAAGADIVHANAQPPTAVLAANWGATLARAPLLVEWYGDGGVDDDRWTRRATKRGDRLVTPSELVATWVRERGADGDDVETVPNPIDVDRIQSVTPADRVDVVYARRLDEGANLESLLLGLAELRGRDWSTTVVGDGPERAAYERLASDLRIEDRITFVGDLSLEERIAVYRGAHVFAQTAEHCVFPTEMCWALASGCVGIVEYHADSSAHELVEGWDRGFRTTSEEELADAILEAGDLEYREFDDRFADYDESVVADRYLEQYRTLQDEHGLL
ncbi:glycosyltransferase family 4 protein [Natronorubrum texcoconense]|uniref:Glycosyltransferase involved in cell wall bisynthesis n=1 Tax=Natronorubrum texcoconense TaxID=1095776 RepID=A0A1G8T609_9EURY|nr:glycosyltransferase family 4 protein [Natronorubrum texcoconense]SDJ36956.1 Glycosyltransferase involved in cell wall bisynthesis [Natronorubrum texcoconense]